MTTALAFGTRDAKLLYHAGDDRPALGERRPRPGHSWPRRSTLDPSFDPLGVTSARERRSVDLP